VVSPVYGCSNCLGELYRRVKEAVEPITADFELILVNDASPDEAWIAISGMARKEPRVKGLNLSRNFGQHSAIAAGLEYCSGEWIVVMDCDLQDRPEEIPNLYKTAQEGFDIVMARRHRRRDPWIKIQLSRFFYLIYNYLTESKRDDTVANFGIYHRQVIDNLLRLREQSRTFSLFVRWMGFNATAIDVEHGSRFAGHSAYNWPRLIRLGVDSVIHQSNKPLRLSINFGFIIALLAFLYGCFLIFNFFFNDVPLGWTSLMVSFFFIAGLLFANLGLLGLYIGKIFDEVKDRPIYIVKDKVNFKDGASERAPGKAKTFRQPQG